MTEPDRGASTRAPATAFADLFGALRTLGLAVSRHAEAGPLGRKVVLDVLLQQILFTGVQALGFIGVTAVLVGVTVVLQGRMLGSAISGDFLGAVLGAVVVRELAPLLTALIVAGRSGVAIATEIGNMRVNGEVLALEALGVDPYRYLVWPRMAASTISVIVLEIYFSGIALLGAHLVFLLIGGGMGGSVLLGLRDSLSVTDAALAVGKGAGLGLLVGWLPCHYGLMVKNSPTEVPQMASRAVITTLLFSFLYSTFLTLVYYLAHGGPLP